MKRITPQKIISWGCCYSRERVMEVFAGRKSMTPLQILDLNIPAVDRLWAVLREEIIPAPYLRWLACHWAEQKLLHEQAAGREPDPRSWAAIDVARRYAQGKATDEELVTAWFAADAAARSAFSASAPAARSAAAAARSAAAAFSASAPAAWSAVWSAVWSTAAAGSFARSDSDAILDAEIECVRVMIRWLAKEEHKKISYCPEHLALPCCAMNCEHIKAARDAAKEK
jgi:hypothetical protein